MRKIALFTLAALLFSGAAHADEAFDGFRNFCVAGRGASAPALAAATAAGWSVVPPQSLSQLTQMGLVGAQARVHQVTGGTAVLLTASGSGPQGGGLVPVCGLAVVPPGTSDLAGQLAAFAAVPPQIAPGTAQSFYAWRDENGRHVSVDQNAPDFQTQIRSGNVFMAAVQSVPQMTMILLTGTAQ